VTLSHTGHLQIATELVRPLKRHHLACMMLDVFNLLPAAPGGNSNGSGCLAHTLLHSMHCSCHHVTGVICLAFQGQRTCCDLPTPVPALTCSAGVSHWCCGLTALDSGDRVLQHYHRLLPPTHLLALPFIPSLQGRHRQCHMHVYIQHKQTNGA
jgi:hypothetical protein